MYLFRRRILYISFIILFLILTPLISLYANGYRFGGGFQFKKTGILIIDSEPKGAKIYIDNKAQKKFINTIINKDKGFISTPAKIKGVLPGEYEIKFELENYWPWQKKLEIKPGQSTFAEDVNLFKIDLPINILDKHSDRISFSPLQEYLISQNKEELSLINSNNEEIQNYTLSSGLSTTSQILWSPDGDKIIVENLIFDIYNFNNPINLKNKISISDNNFLKWGEDNNQIYYSSQQGLHRYNISARFNKNIINENIDDYLIKNNNLFFIKQTKESTELYIYDLNRDEKFYEATRLVKQISLPYSEYEFINQDHNLINLYDKKFNILYLIDPFSPIRPLKDTINNVSKSIWVNDSKLLFANDFEIWIYDLNLYTKTIITRISDKIDSIIWHPNNNYIIYNTSNYINIVELDNREKYNITNLINLNNIKSLHLGEAADKLYFYAQIGNQQGVYKLFIQ